MEEEEEEDAVDHCCLDRFRFLSSHADDDEHCIPSQKGAKAREREEQKRERRRNGRGAK